MEISFKHLCGAIMLMLAPVAGAWATPITFTGSGSAAGIPVIALAAFDISGNQLTITLQNTSLSHSGKDVPGSTLTGLFFDLTGDPTLTPVSAIIPSGSSIIQANTCNPGPCTGVTNVDGEWGYQYSASGFPGSARYGVSSSGYLDTGLPTNIGNFNNGTAGTNLDDPNSLDGINFGIVSAASGFNPNGGKKGLSNVPLIQDAVTFVLSGVSGLSVFNISNVSFQYGTSLSDANITGQDTPPAVPESAIPEPGTLAIMGFGLLLLGLLCRHVRCLV